MYNSDVRRFQNEGRQELLKATQEFISNWINASGYPLKVVGKPKTAAQIADEAAQEKLFCECPVIGFHEASGCGSPVKYTGIYKVDNKRYALCEACMISDSYVDVQEVN